MNCNETIQMIDILLESATESKIEPMCTEIHKVKKDSFEFVMNEAIEKLKIMADIEDLINKPDDQWKKYVEGGYLCK